jgi:hypothetical protein
VEATGDEYALPETSEPADEGRGHAPEPGGPAAPGSASAAPAPRPAPGVEDHAPERPFSLFSWIRREAPPREEREEEAVPAKESPDR